MRRINKKAKILTAEEFDRIVKHAVEEGRNHADRDLAALHLDFLAGLRPCEIAGLEWGRHVCTPTGQIAQDLTLTSDISKKGNARTIPINAELLRSLSALRANRPDDRYVFYPTNVKDGSRDRVTPSAVSMFFLRMFKAAGYTGCSAYSGRRTWITTRARQANLADCSIRDVQIMAGHKSLATTAGYIEPAPSVRRLVEMPLYRSVVAGRPHLANIYYQGPSPLGRAATNPYRPQRQAHPAVGAVAAL